MTRTSDRVHAARVKGNVLLYRAREGNVSDILVFVVGLLIGIVLCKVGIVG